MTKQFDQNTTYSGQHHTPEEEKQIKQDLADRGIEQPNPYLDKIRDEDSFKHQVVKMRNELARKQTRWNATENKLFISALSQINTISEDGWVTLNKADIVKTLNIGKGHTGKELRNQCQSMASKSWLRFSKSETDSNEEWSDGFIINRASLDRNTLRIKFDVAYIDYLKEVGKQWTSFTIGDIGSFRSKYSIVLYQYLRSWYNPSYIINSQAISLINIKDIFNIKEGQYVRKTGKSKGKFDTSNFKKRTIDKAVNEINSIEDCHMVIDEVNTVKRHGFVWGYEFKFSLLSDDGTRLGPPM